MQSFKIVFDVYFFTRKGTKLYIVLKEVSKKMEAFARKFGYYVSTGFDKADTKKFDALSEYVFERDIFFDLSGNMERTNLKKMLGLVKAGDTVYFYSLDGLFKSYGSTKQMLQLFKENRINIRILDLPSTLSDVDFLYSEDKSFADVIMDFVFDVVSKAAKREYIASQNRQKLGFNEARKNGVKLGRKPKPLPDSFEDDYQNWRAGKCTAASIYRKYGISNACFYRKVKQYEQNVTA